jgi:outer membrane beta-barrel protein
MRTLVGQRGLKFELIAVFLVISIGLFGQFAFANDDEDVPKRDVYDLPTPVAIQGRTNNIDQSVSLNFGYIPTDSFNRGFPLSFNYAYYFRPFLAWEVISFGYNFNRETQLKEDFRNLGVAVQNLGFGGQIDFPQNIIMSGIVYTPLYGKSLLFNKSLVHSETSFYLGAGSLVFSKVGHVPTLAPGIQGRYFITPQTAFRYYLRQYFFNDSQLGLTGITDIGFGIETQFELFSRKSSESEDE